MIYIAILGGVAFLLVSFFIFKDKEHKSIILSFSDNTLYLNENKVTEIRKGSINHKFISYIYKHESERISKIDLQKILSCKNEVNLHKLIFNTRLPKEARTRLFSIKNDYFIFKSKD